MYVEYIFRLTYFCIFTEASALKAYEIAFLPIKTDFFQYVKNTKSLKHFCAKNVTCTYQSTYR